jgi:hypothetical protein
MHSRPHPRSNSYPHWWRILSIVPCYGYSHSATRSHRLPEQRVHLPTNIFPRPLGGPHITQLTKYPRICAQDEIERFMGHASLPGTMGILAECY